VLGFVGNTGDASGGSPHLHFQLYPPGHAWGSPVDPKFWLDDMLNRAISHAGGVVPVEGFEAPAPQAAPGVNVGGLMNSVLLAGGHIISQPTVPVLLFVLLVVGTLCIAHTRTFKLAAEMRRSRSRATVPTFLVGGTAGMARQAPVSRPSRRDRRKAAEAEAALADERPVWARSHPTAEPVKPVEKGPGRVRRMIGALGGAWGRLPQRLSGASSPGPKTAAFSPPTNGHKNGHKDGHNAAASTHSWAGAGGKGSTSRPGGWTPASLNGAGARFAKK
jgi:hypothetical protein